jgi:hypothetical protein
MDRKHSSPKLVLFHQIHIFHLAYFTVQHIVDTSVNHTHDGVPRNTHTRAVTVALPFTSSTYEFRHIDFSLFWSQIDTSELRQLFVYSPLATP